MKRSAGLAALILAACLYAAQPASEFHFAILGDRTGRAVPGVYERVWKEMDALNPAFVINVGDSIEGGDDAKAEQEWSALRSLWDRYKRFPLYFTPGNHDVFSEASRKIYERQTGRPVSYSFNYESAHITVLDNSRTESLDEAQIEFLRADLEKNKERSPKFVFFHKPYWIPFVIFKSGNFPLHQIAKRYGVNAIVNGHAHQFMHMTHEGITYLVVGSSGGSMSRGIGAGQGFREGWFYHHVSANVKGAQVDFVVKEIDGPQGKGRTFHASEWGRTGLPSN